jgi:hypothetical protein
VSNLATDHRRRLEHLLAIAKADYDTLAYVILEGATQVTFHSLKRSITVPISGDDVGHINGMLAESVLTRIAQLERELVEAHQEVVNEADDKQLDVDQLAAFRQQARVAIPSNVPTSPTS